MKLCFFVLLCIVNNFVKLFCDLFFVIVFVVDVCCDDVVDVEVVSRFVRFARRRRNIVL